jgi:hypothetical protein
VTIFRTVMQNHLKQEVLQECHLWFQFLDITKEFLLNTPGCAGIIFSVYAALHGRISKKLQCDEQRKTSH